MSGFGNEEDMLETENASSLKFGKEFDDAQGLMNDEVMVLLPNHLNRLANQGGNSIAGNNSTAEKTLEYLRQISTNVDTSLLRIASAEIRGALTNMELRDRAQQTMRLHQFEIASLANLIAREASTEEAIAWIPSLTRFDEESLNEALDKIKEARSRMAV